MENTPRSIRRLVKENETTPSSVEKVSTKRSFAEMSAEENLLCNETQSGSDVKRPNIESKGRRLFSPSTSSVGGRSLTASSGSVFFGNLKREATNLASILEEADSPRPSTSKLIEESPVTPCTSKPSTEYTPPNANAECETYAASSTSNSSLFLAEKVMPGPSTVKQLFSPPFSERLSTGTMGSPETPPMTILPSSFPPGASFRSPYINLSASSLFASPTSNLPNFVVNGEAPHLQLQSPKRKLKENVDWLTKIRKQKLLSSINSQLNEKLAGNHGGSMMENGNGRMPTVVGGCTTTTTTTTSHGSMDLANDFCMSPRLQSLKSSEFSPSTHQSPQTPRRRCSRSGSDCGLPKTPVSRRKPEHTLLRFFSVKSSQSPTTRTGGTSTMVVPSSTVTSNSSKISGSEWSIVSYVFTLF